MARITKREKMELVKGVLMGLEGTEELVEFMEGEIALAEKCATAVRKPTKEQLRNEALKGEIVETLGETEGMGLTATQIAKVFEVSVQKVAQLMKQLVEAGAVTRVEAKGKEKTKFVV
jgi:CTP-dependent riboflavin kinase